MLDLDALLAPIAEDRPTGEDMSFSAEFDRIQELRRADDPTLDQGEWQTDIKYADWPGVASQCVTLLSTRTKDLRLAGWLAEASAQTSGFSGLAQSWQLIAGLCDRYWDEVHPLVFDGDLEERIGNLSWLLSNSLQWLGRIPVAATAQGRYGLEAFESAHMRSRGDGDDSGQPGLDVLDTVRRDTPHDFYRQLLESLGECSEALEALNLAVDARLGIDGPSFSAVRDRLQHLRTTAARFAREAGLVLDGETEALAADAEASEGADAVAAPVARGPAGAPTTRKEALQQLRQVAEFFRRTEPHSPVAYLADKAARWGEMPLHVWLKRVIKDDSVLNQMEEMLDVSQDQNFN